ncbi:hypothetical protein QBC47DRAFT_168957 [Echria macrotheca]|uniref:Uncharacterized protein n=1 Tax=Echria macrotheca TaxID=438768 RepID=A0AAJ0BEG7_9PEZI|nr:hypothetical protein QBC47DRAFT_168957 [Echria macrotheca]
MKLHWVSTWFLGNLGPTSQLPLVPPPCHPKDAVDVSASIHVSPVHNHHHHSGSSPFGTHHTISRECRRSNGQSMSASPSSSLPSRVPRPAYHRVGRPPGRTPDPRTSGLTDIAVDDNAALGHMAQALKLATFSDDQPHHLSMSPSVLERHIATCFGTRDFEAHHLANPFA